MIKAERPENFATPVAPPADASAPAHAVAPTAASAAPPAVAKQVASPVAKTAPLDPAEFKNDPLIKKALEIFKGTIVEVRA
jgi:hypothetical protein